jgi:hypothetical protein
MKTTRLIMLVLVNFIIIFLANDALLYWIDPLGVVAGLHDTISIHRLMIDHPTGYAVTGSYGHRVKMTLLDDYTRLVPDTNINADCTIAAIGDSVTFGSSVNDEDTWVNLLATNYADVHFINAARGDYSAGNIALLKTHTQADGYIWLLFENDAIEPYEYTNVQVSGGYPSGTRAYLRWITRPKNSGNNRKNNMPLYWQSVETIATDNTLLFGFNDDSLALETSTRYGVDLLLSRWTHNVSRSDWHPNAQGHRDIYEQMRDSVDHFVNQICY